MVWLLLVGLAPTERPVAGYVSGLFGAAREASQDVSGACIGVLWACAIGFLTKTGLQTG
ncbi:hypothetical protein [Phaeobacter sp. NW0010-22]|uniref:hypothetical protein n=1 Tax=Phaeobacter sp. NW0010-22 TaxID=3135907 RepID=UPI0013E000F7